MIIVIRGKASKCGNLSRCLTPRAPVAPTTRAGARESVPLSSSSGPSPPRVVIFPYPLSRITIAPHCSSSSVSMMPRARFNLFSSPPAATPRQRTLPPLLSRLAPYPPRFPGPPTRDARACVRRVRACLCQRVRACSCNNNKKRATL